MTPRPLRALVRALPLPAAALLSLGVLTAPPVLPVLPAAAIPAAGAAPAAAAAGRTFYVDPARGSDAAPGTSPTTPWRTLTRASVAALLPGDTLRLRRGLRHRGSLEVTEDGTAARRIRVATYGRGTRPVLSDGPECVRVVGDHVTVSGLAARGCGRAGFTLAGSHDAVVGVEAAGSVVGVWVHDDSDHATVARSDVHDNTRMAPGTSGSDDDWGAIGVDVHGDHARVVRNRIRGHVAASPDYGTDGSAVEVYEASYATVARNRASGNLTFTELGGRGSTGSRFAHNLVTGAVRNGSFLMTRGPGQHWGPVVGTTATRNDVRLTGPGSFGFGCYGGCTATHLVMRDNTVSARRYVGWVDGTFASSGNVWSGEVWFPLGPGDRVTALPR